MAGDDSDRQRVWLFRFAQPRPMTIWCRHEDCQEPFESIAGYRPALCDKCHRVAAWATEQGVGLIGAIGFTLTRNDRRFLKSLRIDPEN